MKIRFKKLNQRAVTPFKAHPTDAGFDLTATSVRVDSGGAVCYGTGIAVELPAGYVGLLFARSSLASKDLIVANSVGVIDADYRGEITVKFKPSLMCREKGFYRLKCVSFRGADGIFGDYPGTERLVRYQEFRDSYTTEEPKVYDVGDRIAQLVIMPIPQIELEEVHTLSATERGYGGYGSTGL